jgi:hypothetical protein
VELLGTYALRAVGATHELAGLEPHAAPAALLETLLAAAADTFGLSPAELAGASRRFPADEARRAFVRLGQLESYTHAQLAAALGRTRSRVTQIAAEPVDELAVRIARTLVSDPRLRCRLPEGRDPTDGSLGRADSPKRLICGPFALERAVD